MNEEHISAMVDDELDAASLALIEQMHPGSDLRRQWSEYHLIADVLRGTDPIPFDMERFRTRLAAEPTILRPPSRTPGQESTRVDRHWVYRGLSVAAGVAGVLVVGTLAMPRFVSTLGPESSIAVNVPASPATALLDAAGKTAGVRAPAASRSQGTVATNDEEPPTAWGMQDYLLAHQPYSASYLTQGVSSFVRPVSEPNNAALSR